MQGMILQDFSKKMLMFDSTKRLVERASASFFCPAEWLSWWLKGRLADK
ncbi:MAG: hypothetical protein MR739_11855 [Spirochaetia bacterium]|nr:hypothetical protein [Spirochaetia bacterium]